MGFFVSNGQPPNYKSRIVEYEGERWRVTHFGKETVHLDFVNVPDAPRDDRCLRMPRKEFFKHLLPRTKGGNT